MHHDLAQVVLIAVLAAAGLIIVVPLTIYLVHKLFLFDWPPLYEWQQARRQLGRIDLGRVIWATYRHHPASRAALADAQLAYARYLQAAAERALDRQRPGRRIGSALLGVAAAGFAALAAVHGQDRIINAWAAAGGAIGAIGNLMAPRSLRRQAQRMIRLRGQIEDRYARSTGRVVPL